MKKRSIWASGNGKVPKDSSGFWVASTIKGSARRLVTPSTVICLSSMASSRADWVRGVARLISSANTKLVKAGPELELTGLLVVEIDAGQIGGQQVGCELHPFEAPAHRARKCTQEHGFAGAGLIFQQYMASAEEADQNFLGSILLAHNDAGTVGHNFFAVGGKSGSVHWCFLSQKQFF